MTNLQKQIEKLNDGMAQQLPHEVLMAFADSIGDLKKTRLEDNCVKQGATIEPFILVSDTGQVVSSDRLFEKYDQLVLAFFRGVWCPYCNLEIKALQDRLLQIEKHGTKLLGISPQKPQYSEYMKQKDRVEFDILYDEDHSLAKALGISFTLQDFVLPYYQSLGINLAEYNGNEMNELPVPALLVVDKAYKVTYCFVDVNYMNRVDLDDLVKNI